MTQPKRSANELIERFSQEVTQQIKVDDNVSVLALIDLSYKYALKIVSAELGQLSRLQLGTIVFGALVSVYHRKRMEISQEKEKPEGYNPDSVFRRVQSPAQFITFVAANVFTYQRKLRPPVVIGLSIAISDYVMNVVAENDTPYRDILTKMHLLRSLVTTAASKSRRFNQTCPGLMMSLVYVAFHYPPLMGVDASTAEHCTESSKTILESSIAIITERKTSTPDVVKLNQMVRDTINAANQYAVEKKALDEMMPDQMADDPIRQ